MKVKYIDRKFRPESLERIKLCNGVVSKYLGMGLRLTLRQLYYQLVTKNVIANTERENLPEA